MSKLVKQTELELKEKIMDALGRAVADGVLDEAPLPAFIIEVPKERQNGDYSTNVAMAGAKAFHKEPRVIAQAIVDRLDLADTVFDRAEIAGPGFINFFLGNRFYAAVLEDLMAQGENYGRLRQGQACAGGVRLCQSHRAYAHRQRPGRRDRRLPGSGAGLGRI